jgi:hypothetical protein
MFTFHDTLDYNRPITVGSFAGKRGPEVYEPDVWGFNPYTKPIHLFSRFGGDIVENCTQVNGRPCVKPLLYGEFGAPASTHEATNDPNRLYPVRWTAPNFVFMRKTYPPAQCLQAHTLGPPPGSGSKGPKQEFEDKHTVAIEMPANNGARVYKMPSNLAPFFKESGVGVGQNLKAALQGDYFREFWDDTEEHKANNNASPRLVKRNSVPAGMPLNIVTSGGKVKTLEMLETPILKDRCGFKAPVSRSGTVPATGLATIRGQLTRYSLAAGTMSNGSVSSKQKRTAATTAIQ